jgi:hypothetical protein
VCVYVSIKCPFVRKIFADIWCSDVLRRGRHATHATSSMLHVLHGFACVAWQRHVSGLRAELSRIWCSHVLMIVITAHVCDAEMPAADFH